MTNQPALRAAALGFFDGVHRGHALILRKTVELAGSLGLTSSALTFSGHPRALTGGGAPPLLTARGQREALIRDLGVEEVVFLTFDRAFASLSPEQFVTEVLVRAYRCGVVVSGENYRFGRGAAGTPQLLRQMGRELGFQAVACPAVTDGGEGISSTRVRGLVEAGDVEDAGRMLGRAFLLSGEVIHGERVGRKLGFPTINIRPEPGLALPARGVYATRVVIDGEAWPAVTNVGVRPTFSASCEVGVESHLFGFDREAYDREASVLFLRRLREERAFSSPEELRAQIARDASDALRAQNEVNL